MEQLVLEYELSGGGLQAIAQSTQPPGHCRVWSNSSVSPLLMLRSPHNTSKGMGTSGPNKSSCGNLSPSILACKTPSGPVSARTLSCIRSPREALHSEVLDADKLDYAGMIFKLDHHT